MAAAPQIRELNGLVSTLTQGAQGQFSQLDSDIAMNETAGQAQIKGLDAKKDRAFVDITQGAQNKGMFFSGFDADSQARYTADTYLPALAQLQQTIAGTRSSLLGKKADLNANIFNKAFDTQESDRSVLADWNKMTAQQQFEASEADKQRAFTAQQNQADRAASASRGGGGGGGGGGGSSDNPAQQMAAALSDKAAKDGFVSHGSYQVLKNQWVSGGYGNAQQFDNSFAGYRNPKDKGYKLG